MRFSHLSFQEFLAGLFVLEQLEISREKNDKENDSKNSLNSPTFASGPNLSKLKEIVKKYFSSSETQDYSLLHDPWWQGSWLAMVIKIIFFFYYYYYYYLTPPSLIPPPF